ISFIPYVGTVVGGVLAIGLALVQFWDSPVWIVVVVAIFATGQFLEGNIVTPRLVGRSVGLHPVWLLVALSAFGGLFGFAGMLVAVPVAAVIGVLVRFGVSRYEESDLYQGVSRSGRDGSDNGDEGR
ncbi:MAG: AI-2E family transporter, partial [Rhodobacteraceae bacterium]|nr:AI-2E family transporter [Paracoccaceae bacterium]